MVDRCNKKIKECIVVDLDNTLIKGNSTVILTTFLMKKYFKYFSFRKIYRLVKTIIRRKLKLISHSNLKYFVIKEAQETFSQRDIDNFVNLLVKKINDDVVDIIAADFNDEDQVLISTAAADFFMSEFILKSEIKNMDYCATTFCNDKNYYIENKGENKLKSLNNYLESHNLHLKTFITDHADDLPILKYNKVGVNYLINPTYKTIKIIKTSFNLERDSKYSNIYLLKNKSRNNNSIS